MQGKPSYFYVRNSSHQIVAADPRYGVEEQWAASVMQADDDSDIVICLVYGRDADDAIANASKVSAAMNQVYGN